MTDKRRFSFIPAAVLRDERLGQSAKLVMAALGMHANDRDEWIFPSQTTIAEMLGMSRETVNRGIKALQAAGYLLSRPRYDKDTKARRSNEYFILYDVPHVTNPHRASDASVNTPCDPSVTNNVPTLNVPTRTKKSPRREIIYPHEFEYFWEQYPHPYNKGSKEKALFSWQKLSAEDIDDIDAALPAFRSYHKQADSTFPKMAVTWLNQSCWETPPEIETTWHDNVEKLLLEEDRKDAL